MVTGVSDIELEGRFTEIRQVLAVVAEDLKDLVARVSVVESRVTGAEKTQRITLGEVRRLAAKK